MQENSQTDVFKKKRHNFSPDQKVLVRNHTNDKWKVSYFCGYVAALQTPFICYDENDILDSYRYCIAFEENLDYLEVNEVSSPEHEFKCFDTVLVRDNKFEEWHVAIFSHIEVGLNYPYICEGGDLYKYCIPYNEKTKHLIGTSIEWEN